VTSRVAKLKRFGRLASVFILNVVINGCVRLKTEGKRRGRYISTGITDIPPKTFVSTINRENVFFA
jgi:hypothetical protein